LAVAVAVARLALGRALHPRLAEAAVAPLEAVPLLAASAGPVEAPLAAAAAAVRSAHPQRPRSAD
jgi:hypothetical protein